MKKFPEFDMITKWNRLLFEKRSAFYRKQEERHGDEGEGMQQTLQGEFALYDDLCYLYTLHSIHRLWKYFRGAGRNAADSACHNGRG